MDTFRREVACVETLTKPMGRCREEYRQAINSMQPERARRTSSHVDAAVIFPHVNNQAGSPASCFTFGGMVAGGETECASMDAASERDTPLNFR